MSMTMLAILHYTSPDGNRYNDDTVQVSLKPREVEETALHDLLRKDLETPPNVRTMNGQVVNIHTMLMCSRCGQWKKDKAFARDKSRTLRRGRCYYCTTCQADMRKRSTIA
jgi:late competence protein required for DNA uptake (superfamily II DNA/RNA helicase)